MKKLSAMVLCLCMLFSLAACAPSPEEQESSNIQAYNDFMADWNDEEIIAVNARVEIDGSGKRVLLADVQNNSAYDITDLVLSFAVWDAQGNFMVIRTQKTPDNTYSEFLMDLPDVTIAPGETWIGDAGLFLADDFPEVAYVRAAVLSCTRGAEEYSNRLYEAWTFTFLNQYLETWMR